MKHLDTKSVWLFFVSYFWRWFFIIVFLSIWSGNFFAETQDEVYETQFSVIGFLNWLWFIVPIFLILCFIWAKLSYYYYCYEMTENGFRKESGVLYKRYVTIPYDRIQNVDIHRNILARLLGLSDLQIQTAGASAVSYRGGITGAGAEGRLPGLSKKIAEELRDELIQKARQSKNQGL